MSTRVAAVLLALGLMGVAREGVASTPTAIAAKAKAATGVVVEVAPPPPSFGTDAAGIKSVAQGEVKKLTALPKHRRGVVISLALSQTGATASGCSVNATVRDARSGNVIAIIESGAHTDGPVSPELRKEMAFAAVRDAVRKVPSALKTKG